MSQIFVLEPFKSNTKLFLLLTILAAICYCQSVAGQSGRRPKKTVTPAQKPVVANPTRETAQKEPDVEIKSILVLGENRNRSYVYSHSNHLRIALKECVRWLENYAEKNKKTLTVTRGKKTSFVEAVARAKEETDTHILWIDLVTRDDGYGNSLIEHIDFAILAPQTGRRLTQGRVKQPSSSTIVGPGGVIVPPRSTRRRRNRSVLDIRSSAREVVNRLIRWEWI